MSVRAYIVREKHIWVNEDKGFFQHNNDGKNLTKYTHTDKEFAFNISYQNKLLNELIEFGAEDYTNNNYLGNIEMDRGDFESMLENSKRIWSREDLDSIERIENYFEEGWNWIVFDCY